MKQIMKCLACEKYTMKETCCNQAAIHRIPPKYSPEDKYASYRRKAKMQYYKEHDLI